MLLDTLERAYRDRRAALGEELGRGTFLRAEVLRQWQDFVGAGQVAKILSRGLGRVRATIGTLFRPGPTAPAAEVREAAFSDLVAVAVQHADAAARHTAVSWMDDPFGARAIGVDPRLWGASPELADRLTADLDAWAAGVGERIRQLGEQRKGWAQVASIGVNAVGTSAVLAVFMHTGGLTGAEVGITAATAVVNQKLLEAIFGEANVAAFVAQARSALGELLDAAFASERARFTDALGPLAARPAWGRSSARPRHAPRPTHRDARGSAGSPAAAAAAARAIGLDEAASRADDVVRRARERVGFPGASYVLALAGGTGVGKSSLLNALAGEAVSEVRAVRPTTDEPIAWIADDRRDELAPCCRGSACGRSALTAVDRSATWPCSTFPTSTASASSTALLSTSSCLASTR